MNSQLGLTSAQAEARLRAGGPNELPRERSASTIGLLLRQMVHFFALMLWLAAALAALAGLPALAGAIIAVVVINGTFSFIQEYRADQAAARLRDLLPAQARVMRDGRQVIIPAVGVVVGDELVLEPGDRVVADVLLRECVRAALDESLLTGESSVVHPAAGDTAFAGTYLVEGTGWGVVLATGATTRLAEVAALAKSAHRPQSPLAKQLNSVVKTIAVIAAGVGIACFGLAFLVGMAPAAGFLFAIGVTVALVPEGLLPTVTLSLARTAQRMAKQNALVRHLEAIETLGSTTFICTDKTGTLTCNQMTVTSVWTAAGEVTVEGDGYEPIGRLVGTPDACAGALEVAAVARRTTTGSVKQIENRWVPVGDPMDAALQVLVSRSGLAMNHTHGPQPGVKRFPFDPRRRRSSALVGNQLYLMGAPDSVLELSATPDGAEAALHELSGRGLRVLAFARRQVTADPAFSLEDLEQKLTLVGLVGLQDPPRESAKGAVGACRRAGISLAMITGDHPRTAAAIARQVGLFSGPECVVTGSELPTDESALADLVDADGIVIARATPEDKLRVARALQSRGHVVAMTGDGVNDAPALREADIGIAMGATGTDVAREAADLVLLDDRFATIVNAIELGRATFANIRRFLTYHLTDNVAELTPFLVWSFSAGHIPLAIGVLQVLALDIGTDLLPALALGAEPPNRHTLDGPVRNRRLVDRALLKRAFLVLGPAESASAMFAFIVVLLLGGWRLGQAPASSLLAAASGTAFAAIVLGQLTNAYACRSESAWVGAVLRRHNPLLPVALAIEFLVLLAFLGLPWIATLLGGTMPSVLGWLLAFIAVPAVISADALHKTMIARKRTRLAAAQSRTAH